MLRTFFRRFPLTASLVVLLSMALSSVMPTYVAFAKVQAHGKTCAQNSPQCDHLYVMASVKAPAETEGAYGVFEQYHPTVGVNDEESLAELDISDGTHLVEVGWVSLPGSASSVIFVYTRDLGNKTNCSVRYINGAWTCDFISFSASNTTGYKPGSPVPSDGSAAQIYLLNAGSVIYIQYGADWLGQIPNTHWSGGSFGTVTTAQWFGEVSVNNRIFTPTQMGNGKCGSATGSASISDMEWFIGQVGSGSFSSVNAPSSSLTQTAPHLYNYGHFTGNSFTYGGSGLHFPFC